MYVSNKVLISIIIYHKIPRFFSHTEFNSIFIQRTSYVIIATNLLNKRKLFKYLIERIFVQSVCVYVCAWIITYRKEGGEQQPLHTDMIELIDRIRY